MLVHKFGGTSVGSADRIAAVAGIIAASHAEGQTVVIVSAMSGTTDRLIAAARAAASGEAESARVALAWIEETHYEAVACLLVGEERLNVHRQIEERLGWVERVLDSIAVLGELTARTYDAVICHGEQLSASILASSALMRLRSLRRISSSQTMRLVLPSRRWNRRALGSNRGLLR